MSSSMILTYHGLFHWFLNGIKMKLPLFPIAIKNTVNDTISLAYYIRLTDVF